MDCLWTSNQRRAVSFDLTDTNQTESFSVSSQSIVAIADRIMFISLRDNRRRRAGLMLRSVHGVLDFRLLRETKSLTTRSRSCSRHLSSVCNRQWSFRRARKRFLIRAEPRSVVKDWRIAAQGGPLKPRQSRSVGMGLNTVWATCWTVSTTNCKTTRLGSW